MSDGPSVIDDGSEVIDDLVGVYRDTCDALQAVDGYVRANTEFWGGAGVLMICLKAVYEDARGKTLDAITALRDAVSTTREHVDSYREDLRKYDDKTVTDLRGMTNTCEQIVTIQIQNVVGGGTSGGSSSGSGSSFSMPSSPVAPTPSVPTPTPPITGAADAPDIHVDVTVDGDGNVKVNVDGDGSEDVDVSVKVEGDGDVDVTVDGQDVDAAGAEETSDSGAIAATAEPDATPETGDAGTGAGAGGASAIETGDATPSGDGGKTTPVLEDGTAPVASPEQRAHEAALYEHLWKDQAARDPLGRSADELRLAWEEREPLAVDGGLARAGASIGYGAAQSAFPATLDLRIPQEATV
jgi:hypothetical protein